LNRIPPIRRTRAQLSQFTTNQLHLRNPWVVAFFAFSYPGFGQLMIHRYVKALILILWELFINQKSKVNLGIMYSLQGHFEQAKEILDPRWLMLYVGLYMYSIWDSFRSTVDLNKLYILADREDAPVSVIKQGAWGTNYLDRRIPWAALAWSAIFPGLGHLYVHKVLTGFFIFVYTIAILYYSNLPLAIQSTMLGDFDQSKQLLDMQWLLYLPSIYCFIFYDAYSSAVEQNKLFEKEQSLFLRQQYQHPDFIMPI
jgi:TM2 domain-containing membrane protein YozV